VRLSAHMTQALVAHGLESNEAPLRRNGGAHGR
jgi:hypothetical protein